MKDGEGEKGKEERAKEKRREGTKERESIYEPVTRGVGVKLQIWAIGTKHDSQVTGRGKYQFPAPAVTWLGCGFTGRSDGKLS